MQKPQLHSSHFSLLYKCGEKFRRVVLEGQREPQTTALVVGTATHATVARDLTRKLETGSLLTDEELRDLARDTFVREWDHSPIILMADERAQGLDNAKGAATDLSIALSMTHHTELAPSLHPDVGGIEQPWVVECKGYPYDLAGTFDVRERFNIEPTLEGAGRTIRRLRDTKTRKRAPSQSEADHSEQLSIYALADAVTSGGTPADSVHLDALVKPTKTMGPRLITIETRRTADDFHMVKARFERAIEVIEKGAFTPASPTDWWCSREFCGFAADGSCPFYSKRPVSVSLSTTKPEGGSNGKRNGKSNGKRVIDADSPEWSKLLS